MSYRRKMSRKHSKRHFTKNAMRVHPINLNEGHNVMRGGIRL